MRKLVIIACLSTLAPLYVSCSKEEEKLPAAPTSKAPSESKLYQSFEGDKLRDKYSSRFEIVTSGGSRSNAKITPPGDMFTDFSIRGKISEGQLKLVLMDLKADLMSLAKDSGVGIVQEPKDLGAERLASLPYTLFKSEYAGSLQGFHFTYRQGSIVGAVDVLAGCATGGSAKEWMLMCSVHEAAR